MCIYKLLIFMDYLIIFALPRTLLHANLIAWGARGRVFESLRPDQWNQRIKPAFGLAFFISV